MEKQRLVLTTVDGYSATAVAERLKAVGLDIVKVMELTGVIIANVDKGLLEGVNSIELEREATHCTV